MAHTYDLTYRDFLDAQALHRKHRRLVMASYVLWFFVLPGVAVGLCLWLFWASHSGQTRLYETLLPVAIYVASISALLLGLRPYTLRKVYRRSLPDGMRGSIPVTFSFGEEGVLSAVSGRSEGRFFWGSILDYAEDEKLALLYVKKKLFLYIPKRAMPETEWRELRAFVHTKTGKL